MVDIDKYRKAILFTKLIRVSIQIEGSMRIMIVFEEGVFISTVCGARV